MVAGFFLLVINLTSYAAAPPPTPGGGGDPACWPPPCIPIDTGIWLLIIAGITFGVIRSLESFKTNKVG